MLARERKLPQNVHLARAPHAKTYKHHIKRIAKISPNTTAANKTHKTSCTHKLSESSIGKLRSSVLIASLGGQRAAQKASARRPRATRCCSTPWGMFARRLFVCLRLYTRALLYICTLMSLFVGSVLLPRSCHSFPPTFRATRVSGKLFVLRFVYATGSRPQQSCPDVEETQ